MRSVEHQQHESEIEQGLKGLRLTRIGLGRRPVGVVDALQGCLVKHPADLPARGRQPLDTPTNAS